ncbi:MAG TPA: indole-3-glycerol phosphate synthase TrpC [Balneolales bacterium]|nr:indole-3-glycerol phosphate synthase TrpC [Balneolales bacterium]
MPDILEKIVARTREALHQKKEKVAVRDFNSFEGYERERLDFQEALQSGPNPSVIAEIKKASPSKGLIRKDFDVRRIAAQYRDGGASALSILTEPFFFQGNLENLEWAREEVDLPLLRKDFIIDPYQIEEARAHGADAVLLIVRICDGNQLQELHHAAEEAELQCLVECYDDEDFQRIDFNQVKILGVNNRDLTTFDVHLHQGVLLLNKAPEGITKVSESGLHNADDLQYLRENGIQVALIGEYFMRQNDPGRTLKNLLTELNQEV